MNAIVAVNSDWGIGCEGTQAIVIPEDRKYFVKMTSGGVVIAGRKTFEDFPGVLPNRKNIIITNDRGFTAEGAIVVHSVEEVLAEISSDDPRKVFVVGGASVYELFLPMCEYIYVTKIEATPPSDTYFQNLDASPEWALEEQSETKETESGIKYTYCTYARDVGATVSVARGRSRTTAPTPNTRPPA